MISIHYLIFKGLLLKVFSFVEPKSRYTNAFKEKLVKSLDGSTVKHAIALLKIPYTSGERFIKQVLLRLMPLLQEQVQTQAQRCQKLVIGIDDFAIRKRIIKMLPIRQAKELKKHNNLLERRRDALNEKEEIIRLRSFNVEATF